MKTNKTVLAALFISLSALIAGCSKKDSQSQNNGPVSYKVKSVINTYTGSGGTGMDTTTYTYDSQGRMTSYAGGAVTADYTITGNNVAISISALPTSVSGTLNASGLVGQVIQSPISSYPEFDASFSYDATGALVSDSTLWVNNGNTGLYDETHITWSALPLPATRYPVLHPSVLLLSPTLIPENTGTMDSVPITDSHGMYQAPWPVATHATCSAPRRLS